MARGIAWVSVRSARVSPGGTCLGIREFGGADVDDVDDVLALINILDELPQADATRIGMYGLRGRGHALSDYTEDVEIRIQDWMETHVRPATPSPL